MSTFCIMKAARAVLTETQALALRYSASVPLGTVESGDLATWLDPLGREWLVVEEPKFTLTDAAVVSRILANLSSFPDFDPAQMTPAEIRAECERFAEEHGLVRPEDIPDLWTEPDPWAKVLSVNGAPVVMRVYGGNPEGWTLPG